MRERDYSRKRNRSQPQGRVSTTVQKARAEDVPAPRRSCSPGLAARNAQEWMDFRARMKLATSACDIRL
eukprot:CAMPEP_0175765800 /NCGR_PEP_ID=MMETSP0097-20121207/68998_1 /TAXON_ID=311494 /ORGANISM="Alexandrium monilatum, Strain CCMP3105" /LENGTH=68 /DNA_ID=CAMNT_0017075689 /DNA_START=1 /DNA_END=204 /DNA_ORIENTATION=-